MAGIKRTTPKPSFKATREKIGKKAEVMVNAVLNIGANWSQYYAPVAYGTLRQSMQVEMWYEGDKIVGEVSYHTKYATYLENNDGWKPKPAPKYGSKKKGTAPAQGYNPKARPGFLAYGFQNQMAQSEIDAAKSRMGFKF